MIVESLKAVGLLEWQGSFNAKLRQNSRVTDLQPLIMDVLRAIDRKHVMQQEAATRYYLGANERSPFVLVYPKSGPVLINVDPREQGETRNLSLMSVLLLLHKKPVAIDFGKDHFAICAMPM